MSEAIFNTLNCLQFEFHIDKNMKDVKISFRQNDEYYMKNIIAQAKWA